MKSARRVVCSVFLGGLGSVPLACFSAHRKSPYRLWELLHERYRESKAFSKAVVDLTLERSEYGGQTMRDCVVWRE